MTRVVRSILAYAWEVQELPYTPAVTPTMPAAPWALSLTRNSMSSFSYDPQIARGGTQSVPSAHTLWQGDDLGWADGVGGGTCLQMFHHEGN